MHVQWLQEALRPAPACETSEAILQLGRDASEEGIELDDPGSPKDDVLDESRVRQQQGRPDVCQDALVEQPPARPDGKWRCGKPGHPLRRACLVMMRCCLPGKL